MKEQIKDIWLNIFKIPENFIVFFSGILVSIAMNILTTDIINSYFCLPWQLIVSAFSMLLSALFLIAWVTTIKPFLKDNAESSFFIESLKKYHDYRKLLIFVCLSLFFLVVGIFFLLAWRL